MIIVLGFVLVAALLNGVGSGDTLDFSSIDGVSATTAYRAKDVIADEDREREAVYGIKQMGEVVKAHNRRVGQSLWELGEIHMQHKRNVADLQPALIQMDADLEKTYADLLARRLELRRSVTAEEWQKIYPRPAVPEPS